MSTHTSKITWQERLQSPLTWHYVGFTILLAAVIVLATRFALDWAAASSHTQDLLAGKQVELRALDHQTAPLRGLDKRVGVTREEIKDFYAKRIPANYSSFASRIGELQVKSGARLTRLTYTQGKPNGDLTEVSLDAGISGQYPQIMHFINSLERDKTFFVIRAMSLTGQQGGLVNLRLRVSTWLRKADAAASGLPQTPAADQTSGQPAPPPAAQPEGE